jgi:single-stranded DNA-binding protein
MAGIKVHFEGKVGKQPELKGEGDKAYVQVGVATERWVGEGKGDVRDYNGQQTTTAYKTTWINIVAFGRQAQYITERFSPGDTIVVNDGELEVSIYEKIDKANNTIIDEKATGLRVIARDISGPFRVVPKADNGGSNGNSNHQAAAPAQQAAPRQAAPRQQAAPRTQVAAPAARQTAQRQAAPAAVQPTQQALIDDDIPF